MVVPIREYNYTVDFDKWRLYYDEDKRYRPIKRSRDGWYSREDYDGQYYLVSWHLNRKIEEAYQLYMAEKVLLS